MSADERLRFIADVLASETIEFRRHPDGHELMVPHKSTAAFIRVHESPNPRYTVVRLSAPLALDIPVDAAVRSRALELMNELNRDAILLRYVFYEGTGDEASSGTVRSELDMVGANLQALEFLEGLREVTMMSARLDDVVVAELGGRTLLDGG